PRIHLEMPRYVSIERLSSLRVGRLALVRPLAEVVMELEEGHVKLRRISRQRCGRRPLGHNWSGPQERQPADAKQAAHHDEKRSITKHWTAGCSAMHT